jgi:hypothetical protein
MHAEEEESTWFLPTELTQLTVGRENYNDFFPADY